VFKLSGKKDDCLKGSEMVLDAACTGRKELVRGDMGIVLIPTTSGPIGPIDKLPDGGILLTGPFLRMFNSDPKVFGIGLACEETLATSGPIGPIAKLPD
jgi:hypothetical protein